MTTQIKLRKKYTEAKVSSGGRYRTRTGPGCCTKNCYGRKKRHLRKKR